MNLNPKPKWNKADMEGWKSGLWLVIRMACSCGKEWVAAAPASSTVAECPQCHKMVPVVFEVEKVSDV